MPWLLLTLRALWITQPLVTSQHRRIPLSHFQFLLDHRRQRSKCSHRAVSGQGCRQQRAAKLNASQATVVVVQACYLHKVCLVIKRTYKLYSQWQKSPEIRATVQTCKKMRPFWGKTWRWFWKSLGQREEAGLFLDTLGLDLINIIIPCE